MNLHPYILILLYISPSNYLTLGHTAAQLKVAVEDFVKTQFDTKHVLTQFRQSTDLSWKCN
jgi:hypothetical protein